MIALQTSNFDITNIEQELDLKIGGIKALSSQKVLTALGDAVFTLSAKAFVKSMNMQAKAMPKKYHHIYEWNKAGIESGRLFFLYKESSSNGVLKIKTGFMQSKKNVPVAPELTIPGKTGKSVASKYVFRDKANVMESGKPIIYRTSKNIPLPDNGSIRFVAAGTIIKNYHPGGKEVKGSFEQFFKLWYSTKVNSIISSSGIIQAIDNETAKVLDQQKAGPTQVTTAVVNLLKQYSREVEVV
jgi:hypothetical protein